MFFAKLLQILFSGIVIRGDADLNERKIRVSVGTCDPTDPDSRPEWEDIWFGSMSYPVDKKGDVQGSELPPETGSAQP